MIKRISIPALALFALAACSNGGGSDGGTSSGGSSGSATTSASGSTTQGGSSSGSAGCGPATTDGGINIILASVGVHPAAVAALTALGLTPPSLSTGYHVVLQAVTLKNGSPSLTGVGSVELTSANAAGPIEFDNVTFAPGSASLGVISAVVADALPDGGTPVAPPAPTCAQLAAGAAGFTDFYVPAGAQVFFGTPTQDICNGVAFALPASYVAVLDCAAGLDPTSGSDLISQGFSLLYASQSAAAGGAPLSSVTFKSAAGSLLYYPAGYAAGSALPPNGPTSTSSVGVATMTGVSAIATVKASDPAGDNFSSRELSTPSDSAYQVFYAPGT